MSLTWNKRTVTDQSVEFPNRFKVDGEQKTIEPDFGVVDDAGTPVNAEYLQPMENFLSDVATEHNAHIKDYVRQPGYGTATGTNTLAITLDPAPTGYTAGMGICFKNTTANTGAVTLNVNGLGAKSILTGKGGALTAGKLRAGGVYTIRYDGLNFTLQGEGGEYGTALPEHVLEPYTIGTEDGVVPGTMPDNGPDAVETVNLTSQNQEYTITQGWHSGLRKIKAVISGLVAGAIRAGTTVGGILGTFTSDATATKSNILSQKTAYVNGAKIAGDMPDNGSQSTILEITGSAKPTKTIPAGYTSGGTVTAQLAATLAGSIVNTATIGGVQGTAVPLTTEKKVASGTYNFHVEESGAEDYRVDFQISLGITFNPTWLIVAFPEIKISTSTYISGAIIAVWDGSNYISTNFRTADTEQRIYFYSFDRVQKQLTFELNFSSLGESSDAVCNWYAVE